MLGDATIRCSHRSVPLQFCHVHNYYVYMLASASRVLYTGVTRDLARRIYEHRSRLVAGFTKRYNVNRLVYFETCTDINAAISREKQIKGLLREKKIGLIERENPSWADLWPNVGDTSFHSGRSLDSGLDENTAQDRRPATPVILKERSD